MGTLKPITIVGGGLAGLTLGIGLRQKGIPVTVWEAGHYPRHRVCGEFISGHGQEALARLGLRETLIKAGAVPAHTAVFFLPKAKSSPRPLPAPALCLSRFTLDALLAEILRGHGGVLLENERWRGKNFGEGIVRACGRRSQSSEEGWRWFGMKVHARNVSLAADLEMHAVGNGYVGLCRLKGDVVNVCGVFRCSVATPGASPSRLEFLQGIPGQSESRQRSGDLSSAFYQRRREGVEDDATPLLPGRAPGGGGFLRQHLANAELQEGSFCSVAGIALRPQRALQHTECCIGDALTMIPPVTGNGMSMAFEAAELALQPLAAYSRGEIPWTEAQRSIAFECDRAFAQRLSWAKCLHWMMFSPLFHGLLGSLALHSPALWRTMFARTR